jgi:hypothetical protein
VLLKRDIAEREKILGRALKVDLSQQQRDALASFYYQNGQKPDGQGRRGFDHMASLFNAGKFDEAAAYFPECDRNSAGEQKAGLRKRRLMEQAVFLHGEYGSLDPIPYWPGAPVGRRSSITFSPGTWTDARARRARARGRLPLRPRSQPSTRRRRTTSCRRLSAASRAIRSRGASAGPRAPASGRTD